MILNRYTISVLVICLFMILALGSADNDDPVTDREPVANEEVNDIEEETVPEEIEEEAEEIEELELIEHSFVEDEFMSSVVGKIRNNSDDNLSYVQVEINLYDAEGNLVGSTLDNVNNLRPGDTWRFEAIVLDDDVDSYSIEGITGF